MTVRTSAIASRSVSALASSCGAVTDGDGAPSAAAASELTRSGELRRQDLYREYSLGVAHTLRSFRFPAADRAHDCLGRWRRARHFTGYSSCKCIPRLT